MNATVPDDYVQVGRRSLRGRASWTVVDVFARERGTNGRFPTVFGAMRVFLEQRVESGQWRTLPQPLEATFVQGPSGTVIFTGKARSTRTQPEVTIPPARYRARVVSAFYKEEVVEGDFGSGVHAVVELDPGYAYPFPATSTVTGSAGLTLLRGTLHRFDGQGVAGAIVRLLAPQGGTAVPSYETDGTGQWMLIVPDPPPGPTVQGRVGTVEITLPGAVPFTIDRVAIVHGRENGLTQTAVRGWVLRRSAAPIAGAVVTIANHPGSVLTRSDGAWSYHFDPRSTPGSVLVTVTAPDGERRTQSQVVVDRATTTVPTFRFS